MSDGMEGIMMELLQDNKQNMKDTSIMSLTCLQTAVRLAAAHSNQSIATPIHISDLTEKLFFTSWVVQNNQHYVICR